MTSNLEKATSVTSRCWLRIGFVRILSVEVIKKILSIGDMLDEFLSTFTQTIAKPIDQIIKFVANKFGVKDGSNLESVRI